MEVSSAFWTGKRVFLTGNTGFKGSWLSLWLQQLGAEVTGYALAPSTTPNLFESAQVADGMVSHIADIGDYSKLVGALRNARPDIVFHLAAQPLVRESYRNPLGTFSINVMGTAHVLEAIRQSTSVRVAVMITTDKVYRNNEWFWPYREEDVLGGHDPYSASKAASEVVITSYRDAFLTVQGIAVASARAGNVIGGGDWSEDRLIPDAVRAWSTQQTLPIRRPDAIRPWQHVLEPLSAYLRLAERLWNEPKLAGAYNFGPHTHEAATVRQVVTYAQTAYGAGEVAWGEGTDGPHEAGWLALEIAKARNLLGVEPRWDLAHAVSRTMHWYRRQNEGEAARRLCEDDLAAYTTA
ncbi:MAG: CDP-glucose 4,6-dehydratase [Methylococcus sp.]|nr:CDP-glucose 4,6-dehydratase [Methylococcus sp.]